MRRYIRLVLVHVQNSLRPALHHRSSSQATLFWGQIAHSPTICSSTAVEDRTSTCHPSASSSNLVLLQTPGRHKLYLACRASCCLTAYSAEGQCRDSCCSRDQLVEQLPRVFQRESDDSQRHLAVNVHHLGHRLSVCCGCSSPPDIFLCRCSLQQLPLTNPLSAIRHSAEGLSQ